MALFSISVRTSGAANATAAAELVAAAAVGYRLLECGFTINAATATVLGFGIPAAIGITPGTTSTVQAEDQNNTTAGNTLIALTWGTGPTAPTNFNRRVSMPATVGSGFIWTFPRGFTITKAKTCVLWNLGTNSVLDTWVVVDE